MKKRIAAAAALIICLIMFNSCGESPEEAQKKIRDREMEETRKLIESQNVQYYSSEDILKALK